MATISSNLASPFHGRNAVVATDGPPASSLVTLHGLNVGGNGDLVKKKRGRPRKYGPDGSMALALTSVSPTSASALPGFSPLSTGQTSADLSVSDTLKKARGRPSGSGKKHQLLALGNLAVILLWVVTNVLYYDVLFLCYSDSYLLFWF